MSGLPSRYGSTPAEVVIGPVAGLGARVGQVGLGRVLVVTDRGVSEAGHADRVCVSLREAGLTVVRFEEARPDPTHEDAARCAEVARSFAAEGLVAVGGGSCVDTAKAAGFLLTNGGRMEDYRGFGVATRPLPPLFAVPTTAGAGSEVQSFALISRAVDHAKLACGAATAMPRLAWLDPELTLSTPRQVTITAGLDALTHAIETAVSRVSTPDSRAHAVGAARRLWAGLDRSIVDPNDLEARTNTLIGATMAGQAIEASMLGAAHALANPLTARFGLAHGLAVGWMLPKVVCFNQELPEIADRYSMLAAAMNLDGRLGQALEAALDRWGVASEVTAACAGWSSAREALVAEALEQWTGSFNPRPLDPEGVRGLYAAALSGVV